MPVEFPARDGLCMNYDLIEAIPGGGAPGRNRRRRP